MITQLNFFTNPGGTRIVHFLQDTAKDESDDGFRVVLFASSESSVPNIMQSRSAISRLRHTIHIGDITDKEAFESLTCMCPKYCAITNKDDNHR